jgi:hypothetical protein
MQQAELGHVGGQAGDVAQVAALPFADNDLVNTPSRHRAGPWVAGTASVVARDLGSRFAGLRLRGAASARNARMADTR